MAKLIDLRTLLDKARSADSRSATPAPVAPAQNVQAMPVLKATGPGAQRVLVKRHAVSAKHADGDIDIGKAFADVTRMPPHNRVAPTRERPTPQPRLRMDDERDALRMSKYGAEPAPHSWEIGQELEGEQTFRRRGLGSDILVNLRRGHWAIQAAIDLHGMTTAEAHDALADFLLEARNRGLRCVHVIHGKGLTSPNKEPVLKGKVRRWLTHWDDVLAYCEAPGHAGGSGAVVALLRGR
ncbi:MAG TPA: Smr/MutS family protein [Casimicrobiaceae bacterium]